MAYCTASKASGNNISKDEDVRMSDFEAAARDIQNRAASRRVGMATSEARHFHEFFRTSVRVVEILRDLLLILRDNLVPETVAAQSICFGCFAS